MARSGLKELLEEAGVRIDPAEIREFQVRSGPDSTLLAFGIARPRLSCSLLPFVKNEVDYSAISRMPYPPE